MSYETFMTLIEIVYDLYKIALITLPLFGIPYGIKKLKHWKEKGDDKNLNKGCVALIVSVLLFILFILFAIKDIFFRHH